MLNSILSTADNPRVAFQIGSFSVEWYGLIIVCGMIIALLYAVWQSPKIGIKRDDTIELFLWLIPLAIVFARLLYVFPRWDDYVTNSPYEGWDRFVNFIAIWKGGITIIGGLVGGLIGAVFFTIRHRKKTNFLNVVDLVVVPVLIGQIVGRWGNFVNQEAFGLPITNEALQCFPFGVYITDPSGIESEFSGIVNSHIAAGGGGNWFCATFFYESIWNLIGAGICIAMWRKDLQKKYPGILMAFYLFWYCGGRFWLEFLRMDAVPITKIACGIVAILALIVGAIYVVVRTSQLAYRKVKILVDEYKLAGAILTEYEVKNYQNVSILNAKANKQIEKDGDKIDVFFASALLKLLYVNKKYPEYIDVDFDAVEFYHVPKNYKQIFKQAKKQEYTRMQDVA